MARQILPTLDIRTPEERMGLSESQALARSLQGILTTIGQAEKVRRERLQLDRVSRAIAGGATTAEAILAAAREEPEFAPGLRGGLQRIGGAFAPPDGGIGEGIQQTIISDKLREALTPSLVVPEGLETTRITRGPGGVTQILERPKEPPPSQQISQEKLNRINELQDKIQAGTATERDEAMLDKMLTGVSPVQITIGKPAAASERTAIAETQASLDALDNLENLFNSAQTVTGPVAGRIAPAKGLLELTTDEQEAFMAATSAFKNSVIKDITGAQMSEPEAKRIMKQIPDITDPPTRWKAKLEQTRKNLKDIQKRRSQVLQKSGIVSPLEEQTGANIPRQFEFNQQGQVTSIGGEQLDKPLPLAQAEAMRSLIQVIPDALQNGILTQEETQTILRGLEQEPEKAEQVLKIIQGRL